MNRLFGISHNPSYLHVWLLLLRVGVAACMLTHGWPKLMKVLGGDFQFMDPIGIGAAPSLVLVTFSEAICSFLILLGLATRLATIPLIISCSVAALVAHAGDPFGKKEVLVLYILIYITLLVLGGGKYSADAAISQNKRGY
ncbi:DoxX family protein [Rhabdobacter roseus]|uniref:Putative oxidoreductase n=1 Tax=Rhabdobacter roseus TaxID=1655419 RepID=A0A840TFS4_9BACT|nr:DoxX family protein [Rhabdobacter roseus]MBB5282996.1 putative oxidoreductase [Rhabdobacter roseus]